MLELPVFTDSHVHLGLIDGTLLRANGIGKVIDLGWDPAVEFDIPGVRIERAGPLLAAPGGYPLNSGWAPAAATWEIPDAAAASSAIASVVEMRAKIAKITLNSEAGPVWDDELLGSVVRTARKQGLLVVAHVQGAGQAERALTAGVDCLAHTPWTEELPDRLLQKMVRARMFWVSTLDIHGWGSYGTDFSRAVHNLERFAAFGGRVFYGTDLGNGPLPVGLNARELRALEGAGLSVPQIVQSLSGIIWRTHDRVSVVAADALEDLTIDALLSSTVKDPE